jgi:hypothetical protein
MTIRHGKAVRMRRVMLSGNAVDLLCHYLTRLCCPQDIPATGSDAGRVPLIDSLRPDSPP